VGCVGEARLFGVAAHLASACQKKKGGRSSASRVYVHKNNDNDDNYDDDDDDVVRRKGRYSWGPQYIGPPRGMVAQTCVRKAEWYSGMMRGRKRPIPIVSAASDCLGSEGTTQRSSVNVTNEPTVLRYRAAFCKFKGKKRRRTSLLRSSATSPEAVSPTVEARIISWSVWLIIKRPVNKASKL